MSRSTAMVSQMSWNAGQVDQTLWRRTDLGAFQRAAKLLQNLEITFTGSAKKRRASSFCSVLAKATMYSQMYPYQDKFGQYYILLAYNLAMDVISLADFSVVATITTPYLEADIVGLDYGNNGDVIVFTNTAYPQARIYISDYTLPYTFTYQALDIYPQPAYDFGNINYNQFAVSLSVSGNTLTFEFTGLSGDPGFTSAWVGGQIIGGGTSEISPVGYAIITAVSFSGSTTTFTATIYEPFETTNYVPIGNSYSIRQPVFTAELGYPAVINYYQNRLFFGNTASLPDVLFGSRVSSFTNFDTGIGGPADALIYNIGQSDTGGIVAINAGKQLEIYTRNYEFACPQELSVGLTPDTFSIRQQSAFGSNGIMKPVSYLNDSYYCSKQGSSIINYHFNGVGLSYTSTNVTLAAQEQIQNPINRALQRSTAANQNNFLYFLNEDRTLTTFQFNSEFKDNEVPIAACTPLVFEENVNVIDIIGINDQTYFLKYYTLTEIFTLEVFDDQIFSGNQMNQVFLDSVTSTTMDDTGLITGLENYNGYTLTVVYDGQDLGDYLVEDDELQVYNPDGLSGSVYVGLPYPVVFRSMDRYAGPEATDLPKLSSYQYVDYYQSIDFYIDGKQAVTQTFLEIQNEVPIMPKTGTYISTVAGGYLRNDDCVITQNSPFGLEITGLRYQIVPSMI